MEHTTINDRLNARINELGIKKRFLAERFQISEQYFYAMLKGNAQINKNILLELVGYLGLNSKELRREFPFDFNRDGSISAVGYRPRDNQ